MVHQTGPLGKCMMCRSFDIVYIKGRMAGRVIAIFLMFLFQQNFALCVQ